MPDSISQGAKWHDRATRGEILTQTQRSALETWYRQQDKAEMGLLQAGQTQALEPAAGDVQAVLTRIKETSSRIQALDLQNASLWQEIATLQKRLYEDAT